jgi:hypothetical protein
VGSLRCASVRLQLLAVRQRHFEQQATGLPVQQWRHDRFHMIARLDEIRPPADPLHHVDARQFEREVVGQRAIRSRIDADC